jgi:hypothetical protein
MPRINQQALKTELAKRGFESISIKRELPGGRVEVDANKLHPVHDEGGQAIYAPVPVSLSVELDGRGQVKSTAGDTPAAVADLPQLAPHRNHHLRPGGHFIQWRFRDPFPSSDVA